MALIVLFVVGYVIGSVSALLIVGLTLASRKARMARPAIEVLRYDVDHASL